MAVAPPSSSSLNVFIVGFVFLLVVPHLLLHVSCKAGFSDELINRDSPKSHPASTPLSRLDSSIRRSASYADYLRTANPGGNANSLLVRINNEGGAVNSGNANSTRVTIRKSGAIAVITSYSSHYVVTFKIGFNKHQVTAVLEIAADFTWLECYPCPTCQANHPIFYPEKSHTNYKWDCEHDYCKLFGIYNCDGQHKCLFSHKYYPGTVNGTLSRDLMTMRSTNQRTDFSMGNVIYGCINAIKGEHFHDSMGVLGLGSGQLSLVNHMLPGYGKTFSYCLPINNGSKSYLKFGSAAKVEGDMLTTALDSSQPPFHKIILNGIYVGGTGGHTRWTFDNIVISTSFLNTHIDMESLRYIWEEVKKRVTLPTIEYTGYDHCYNTYGAPVNLKMPNITLIFRNNAQLVLEEDNAFVRVDNNVLCLAIRSNERSSGTSILGIRAHRGNLMLFDVDKRNLRFRSGAC